MRSSDHENSHGNVWDEIVPNLFLGSHFATRKEHLPPVQTVITIMHYLPKSIKELEGKECHYFKLGDDMNTSQEKCRVIFDQVAELISQNLANGVLVHCQAGQSRSAACVLNYLMKHHSLSFDEAYKLLESRRPEIYHINWWFSQVLKM